MITALLLIAHGSRHAEANDDLFALARNLRETGPFTLIEPSFLELAQPTIGAAAKACVTQGAKRVILLPYFLSAGVHVKRDLQAHRDRLAEEHPQCDFILGQPLGSHALLRTIVLERAREAEQTALDG